MYSKKRFQVNKLKCEIVEGDFMHIMRKDKDMYQKVFDESSRRGKNKI